MSNDRRKAFEARLAQLKHQMEAGLADRARILRQAAEALAAGDESARTLLKTEGHKLRGIAGTYGHGELAQLAAKLEGRAGLAPIERVVELARELAQAAERTSRNSQPPPPAASEAESSAAAGAEQGEKRITGRQRMISQRPKVRSGDGAALRVLAIDDEPNTQRLLTLTLKDVGGYDATILGSARAALTALDEGDFDVVISDAMMPDMSGKDFVIAARARGGAAARMPIVILSAASEEELGWMQELTGPVFWMRKPFSPRSLVDDVARVVEQHREG